MRLTRGGARHPAHRRLPAWCRNFLAALPRVRASRMAVQTSAEAHSDGHSTAPQPLDATPPDSSARVARAGHPEVYAAPAGFFQILSRGMGCTRKEATRASATGLWDGILRPAC